MSYQILTLNFFDKNIGLKSENFEILLRYVEIISIQIETFLLNILSTHFSTKKKKIDFYSKFQTLKNS